MNNARLKRLVRVQDRVRTAKRGDVASAQLEMARRTERVEFVLAEQRVQHAALRETRSWSHAELLLASHLVEASDGALSQAQAERGEAAKELESRQLALRAADQDVKRLERLQSQAEELELRERRLREQRALDEVASRRRARDED